MVSCSGHVAKIVLFVFNLVLFLIGAAVIVVGILAMVSRQDVLDNMNNMITIDLTSFIMGLGIGSIITGSVLFVVGFFGCCGAIRENVCMLRLYAFSLLLIAVAYLVILILAFVFKAQELQGPIDDALSKSYVATNVLSQEVKKLEKSRSWDFIQISFECCGTAGVRTYENMTQFKSSMSPGQNIPYACCKFLNANARNKFLTEKNLTKFQWLASSADNQYLKDPNGCQDRDDKLFNNVGCIVLLNQYLNDKQVLFVVFSVIPLIVLIFGVILAFCLINAIRSQ